MKHPRRLLAGCAALALAATAGVIVVRDQQGASPGSNAAAAVEATATPGRLTDAQKKVRKDQVDVVLAARARAVLKGSQGWWRGRSCCSRTCGSSGSPS